MPYNIFHSLGKMFLNPCIIVLVCKSVVTGGLEETPYKQYKCMETCSAVTFCVTILKQALMKEYYGRFDPKK